VKAPELVVYGADDVGAGLVASGVRALWIRPPESRLGFPVSYLGNGEVEATARRIFGDAVAERLWALSRENLAIARAHWPGRAVPVVWRLPSDEHREVGWHGEGRPACEHRTASLVAVRSKGSFRYELELRTEKGPERLETAALVVADEILPPTLFPSLETTWLLPACTELVGTATPAAPEGLVLEHGGVDYAYRWPTGGDGNLRVGSFRGLQDDEAIRRPVAPSRRGTEALRAHYGERARWLDVARPVAARVYEAALPCDGLPIVGPLAEAPGVFVVGAFAARERNFRAAAVKSVLEGLVGRRSPSVEALRPGRFA
jgi:hypothetical protein